MVHWTIVLSCGGLVNSQILNEVQTLYLVYGMSEMFHVIYQHDQVALTQFSWYYTHVSFHGWSVYQMKQVFFGYFMAKHSSLPVQNALCVYKDN